MPSPRTAAQGAERSTGATQGGANVEHSGDTHSWRDGGTTNASSLAQAAAAAADSSGSDNTEDPADGERPGNRGRKRPRSQKFKRSKNGCLSCRRKRVKCDEMQPVCSRCVGHPELCIYPPVQYPDPASLVAKYASYLPQLYNNPYGMTAGLGSTSAHPPEDIAGNSTADAVSNSKAVSDGLVPNTYSVLQNQGHRDIHWGGSNVPVPGPLTASFSGYPDSAISQASTIQTNTVPYAGPDHLERSANPNNRQSLHRYRSPPSAMVASQQEQTAGYMANHAGTGQPLNPETPLEEANDLLDQQGLPSLADLDQLFADYPSLLQDSWQHDGHDTSMNVQQVQQGASSGSTFVDMLAHYDSYHHSYSSATSADPKETASPGPQNSRPCDRSIPAWAVPANALESVENLLSSDEVELMRYWYTTVVPCSNPIDHPNNPHRTLVARYGHIYPPMRDAVMAVSSLHRNPASTSGRIQGTRYFERSVKGLLEGGSDIMKLATLGFLDIWYAMDTGVTQPEQFAEEGQRILSRVLDQFRPDYLKVDQELRSITRRHLSFEVMANLTRQPGHPRLLPFGDYPISRMLDIVDVWDKEDGRIAGLSAIHPEYTFAELSGLPTVLCRIFHEMNQLLHEMASLRMAEESSTVLYTSSTLPLKLKQKIRDLESRIRFVQPNRVLLPSCVAADASTHRERVARMFDVYRHGCHLYSMVELRNMDGSDPLVQETVNQLSDCLEGVPLYSPHNYPALFVIFMAGCLALNLRVRDKLRTRLQGVTTANATALLDVQQEVWQQNEERLPGAPMVGWRSIVDQRGWTLWAV